MTTPVITWSERYNRFRAEYGKAFAPAFFILGFIFDAVALQRVDELFGLVQQAVYVLFTAILVAIEMLEHERVVTAPRGLTKVWKFREFLLQFMFGTLLNVYVIFYFKSASGLTSLAFIVVMAGLILLHEFKKFGRYQTHLHAAILSLCLISYLGVLVPILGGFIGPGPFFAANVLAWFTMMGYRRFLRRRVGIQSSSLRSRLTLPFALVQIIFVFLYVFRVLPPVPLSISYMGIFHNVEKEGSEYRLTSTRPAEYFWQHGDQTFLARPGDTIYCFIRVFAPARFKDDLKVRWLYRDEKQGWMPSDAIPLSIVGGREEGFRGVTKKVNYQPGAWRVQVETADGREVGRIGFTVTPDASEGERSEHVKID